MYPYDLSGKNKYYTLYENLRGDILHGRIKSGEKLPGKRTLARELGVSVVTVQTAYDQLLAEGYVRSRERSGYYVCPVEISPRERPAAPEECPPVSPEYVADFVKGSTPAELFPFSTWAKLMREVLSDCGEHLLEKMPAEGDRQLKSAIADYLYRARGISVDPRLIIIGAGAEQLYGTIVQLVGRDKLYGVENPCYRKIYQTYSLNGAKCVFPRRRRWRYECGRGNLILCRRAAHLSRTPVSHGSGNAGILARAPFELRIFARRLHSGGRLRQRIPFKAASRCRICTRLTPRTLYT